VLRADVGAPAGGHEPVPELATDSE
jgi:hypothetical protein